MCAQRLWPGVHALGRTLINNRTEIIQQGFKAYNAQNFNSGHFFQGQQQQPQNSFQNPERPTLTQQVNHIARGSFNKVVARSLHSGTVLFVKEFRDTENEHAHEVLLSLPAYSATTVTDLPGHPYHHRPAFDPCSTGKELESCSPDEVADAFIATSQQCHSRAMDLEDKRHSRLCYALTSILSELSDTKMINVLHALSLWPPTTATTTPNFMSLWNALDRVCTFRMNKWDMTRTLLVADHWYVLRLSRITSYNNKLTRRLGKNVDSMKPYELVQYLFYANLSRKLEPVVTMSRLEKRLIEVIEHLTVEELGIISMGFFKTQTFLKNEKLISEIIAKTSKNLEVVSSTSLCAILKLLRKSTPVAQCQSLYNLMESLLVQIPNLNHMCLLQLALLGNDLLVFHREAINLIAVRFAEDISDVRLKDLERIAFALMLYNFVPPSQPQIFEKIANELRRPERISEINHYPKCFVSCVVYLVTMGLFPQDLISAALQPSMLSFLEMSPYYNDMGREVMELDFSLQVEGPESYQGYRLHPDLRNNLVKKYMGKVPTTSSAGGLTHQERLLLDVQEKLGAFLGSPHCVVCTHVLPHNQTADLVFCTTVEGEPVEIPQDYLDISPLRLKRPANNGLQWNAVIVAGRNAYLRNTYSLRGSYHMKMRQLNKLGYHVSVVPHMDYSRRSIRSKLSCLERCLQKDSTLSVGGRLEFAYADIKGLQSPQKGDVSVRERNVN